MHYKEIRRNTEGVSRWRRYEQVVGACQSLFAQGVSISYRAIASWLGLKEIHFYHVWVQASPLIPHVVYNYRKLQMELSAA